MAEKWQLLDTFSSESEMLAFFNTRLPRNAITHKNKSKCTHCGKGEDGEPAYPEHDMMVIYRSCRSRGCGERCPVRYKLIVCEVGRIYNSFKLGEHPVQIPDLPPDSDLTTTSSTNLSHEFKSNKSSIYTHRKQLVEHNGIDPKIKRSIEKLVKSGETNASKILAQISKTKDARVRLPTLYQVQSFVSKNRSLASPKSRGVSLYNNFNQVTRIEDDEEDTQSDKNNMDEQNEETVGLANSGTDFTDNSSLFSESNEANAAVSELLKCLLKQSAVRSAVEPSMAEVLSAFGVLKRFLSGRIVRMQTTLANLNQVESLVLQASGVDEIVDRIDEFLDNTGALSK